MSRCYFSTKHWRYKSAWRWAVLDLGLYVRRGDAPDNRTAVLRANNARDEYLESVARHRATQISPLTSVAI